MISISTIQDLAFINDGFQKGVSHSQPLFKFFWSVDQKVNRDIPFDHSAKFSNSICAIEGRFLFDDQKISITVNIRFSSSCASKENDLFGLIFFYNLDCNVFNFFFEINSHLCVAYYKVKYRRILKIPWEKVNNTDLVI